MVSVSTITPSMGGANSGPFVRRRLARYQRRRQSQFAMRSDRTNGTRKWNVLRNGASESIPGIAPMGAGHDWSERRGSRGEAERVDRRRIRPMGPLACDAEAPECGVAQDQRLSARSATRPEHLERLPAQGMERVADLSPSQMQLESSAVHADSPSPFPCDLSHAEAHATPVLTRNSVGACCDPQIFRTG